MGGGAASSMVQGENEAELDFNAVQRGDAEMEQKLNRVIRACVELGDQNPIVSIHDQGAGGNCNVLKEIVEPAGARIDIRAVPVGDETLSVLEIWGAEYQENNALLIRPEHAHLFHALCKREKVIYAFVGEVTGDGRVVVFDSTDNTTPVDLDLGKVLGDMPQKPFKLDRFPIRTEPITLPENLTVEKALDRVLRLVSVGSKRFLTNKVDRCVTGLVAQQQCVGPLQLTAADVAVIAQSHFGTTGAATAIGEQPIKGLIDPAAMGTPVRGRNAHQYRLGAPECHRRHQVFWQLDVGGKIARRRRGTLRCGPRPHGYSARIGHCHRWRQRQPFNGCNRTGRGWR